MKPLTLITELINEIVDKKITVFAAQAAFFLLISIIPFIMTVMNIIQFFSIGILSTIYHYLGKIPSHDISNLLIYLVSQLALQSNKTVISVSIVSTIWSSSKGVHAIEYGLNEIYGTKKNYGIIISRILSFLFMILFLLILLITTVILMFGSSIETLTEEKLPAIIHIILLLMHLRLLILVPVLVLFCMCLYTFYPGRRLRFREQFWGAVCATGMWIIFSFCFEFYVEHATSYSQIYGSMGAILLLMLWGYFCICIILLGAELNVFLKKHLYTSCD